MQKHNKYLIVTIWVATIAFIGAGFVGWGSYQYGSKASSVGQVGGIEITQEKLDMSYQNLYGQYNEMFKGKFDDAKAKEMGLIKMAFNGLVSQAQLLNLASEYGIVVSDEELGKYVRSIKGFHDGGKFSKVIYDTYLKNRGMKPKAFESVLRDELVVKKLMDLLDRNAMPYETEILASALSIADKVAYKVISPFDIDVKIDDKQLNNFWEQSKGNYMTKKAYELAILWTDSKDVAIADKELRDYFDKNSFNYVDAQGNQFEFEKAKGIVEQDFKVKKSKKQALLDYVALKKGGKSASETKTIEIGSQELSKTIWEGISKANSGDILKPKVVGSRYATIKILSIVEPKEKSFDQAKELAREDVTRQKKNELLEVKSKETLAAIDTEQLTTTKWMTMSKFDNMLPLSQQETLQFLQKLFTSSAKKGMIRVSNAVVVYRIVDQKMDSVDNNLPKGLVKNVNQIKKSVFEKNLFKMLNDKYPTKKYVKGI